MNFSHPRGVCAERAAPRSWCAFTCSADRQKNAWCVCALSLILALAFAARLPGATVITGDVTPALPWTSLTPSGIGNTGAGTLVVDEGSQLSSNSGALGVTPGSEGTATITGVGSAWTNRSAIIVGRSGAGALHIEAGGQVSNSIGFLADIAGSTGTATITGAGSKWVNGSSLYVGNTGSGALRVEAGGQVSSATGYMAAIAGSTGTATITGAGSTWTNSSSLYVGRFGSGALTVEDGGHVSTVTLYASLENLHGNGTIAAAGAVLDADLQFNAAQPAQVTFGFGAGGTLNVTLAGGELGAGYKGLGSLTISEGVAVSSSRGYLGHNPGSTGTATITGAGSKWTNSGWLQVGLSGSGVLRVEAGGQLRSTESYLGASSGSTGAATITGAGSAWTNSSLSVSNGSLNIEAAGQVSSANGHLAYNSSSSTGAATVTGVGSKWTISDTLSVGDLGSGALRVEAGGQVSNADCRLGLSAGSTGTAMITGAGSKWTNSSELYVGLFGSGELRVEAGGQVTSDGGYLRAGTGRTSRATVTGAGSKWTSSWLYVGFSGNGALRVEAGGQVTGDGGHLGGDFLSIAGGTGTATITGAGSKWTNSLSLRVGISGNGVLRVEEGGQVSDYSGELGVRSGTSGTATITGVGSTWTNSYSLIVGRSGSGALTITAGGLVSVRGTLTTDFNGGDDSFVNLATGGMLALWGNADDSLAQFLGLVSGTDAIRYWNASLADWAPLTFATPGVDYTLQYQIAGDLTGYTLLTVGTAVPEPGTCALAVLALASLLLRCRPTRNLKPIARDLILDRTMPRPPLLRTENAWCVCALSLILALAFAARLPGATVITGDVTPALPWDVSTYPRIGSRGAGTLDVDGGSQLSSGSANLGDSYGSTGTATITGARSEWTAGELYVGRSGNGALRVEEGGQVSNGWGYLGNSARSTGTATITGTGSKWTNTGALTIGGDSASVGALRVEAGGQAESDQGRIARRQYSTGTATITGAGSKWTNSSTLFVGWSGRGQLRVEAGGQVSNDSCFVGYEGGSTGTATITGLGSKWTNSSTLMVGYKGSGALTVEDGGQVTAATLFASLGDLRGNGTIAATRGAVLDADLKFDAAHPAQAVLGFGAGGTLTVTVAGASLGAGYKGGPLTVAPAGPILGAGYKSLGSLTISEGIAVTSSTGYLGYHTGSAGTATITGAGSKWANSSGLSVGSSGGGALRVEAGGQVSNSAATLGYDFGSTGAATITGAGSQWINGSGLNVGFYGSGVLTITGGGLVRVREQLLIDASSYGNSFVNLATRGMLALWGNADDSLAQFLDLAYGTDAIRYWNAGLTDWAPLTAATLGVDYTLQYQTAGDLTGYTLLTVGTAVPEPGTCALVGVALATLLQRCRPTRNLKPIARDLILDRTMPRPPLLQTKNTWCVCALSLILALAFAPRLPGATVITGDVTPALPWSASTQPRIGNSSAGTLAVDGGSQLSSGFGILGDYAGSTGTATITGAGSKWINSSALYIGGSGGGALRVEAGGQVSSTDGYMGFNTDSTGTATITGAGSTWTNSSRLYVGRLGSGALTVENGGRVSAETLYASLVDLHGDGTIATSGAVLDADLQFNAAHPAQAVLGFGAGGTLTVTAVGGVLGAGYKGLGSLTISEGAAVSSSTGYLGYNYGSTGMATITGAGSTWTNSVAELYVGRSGSGALRVDAGGQVSTNFGHVSYLGYNPGSTGTATITGAGSKWTNSSTLYVGFAGSGALRVEASGQVSSLGGILGNHANSTGTATITGAGSKWTSTTELHVGRSGSGALRVEAGGQVVCLGLGYLGYGVGSTGAATITGAGSKWTNNSILYVGHSGSASLRVEAGGQLSNTFGHLGFSAGSTGAAAITGAGSRWSNSTTLDVGYNGSGALTITSGGLVSVRGTLTIDANGGNDSFVNLATGGMLALWGNADDSLAQFLGLVAGTDAIRYWNTGLANWAPLTAATLGADYTLQYQAAGDLTGYTLLTVLAPGPAGDFDFDGRVDGADLLAWQRGNSPLPNSPEDLAAWRANFGLGATTPVTTPVPEPGTLALVGLALATLLLRCRSTHSS